MFPFGFLFVALVASPLVQGLFNQLRSRGIKFEPTTKKTQICHHAGNLTSSLSHYQPNSSQKQYI